LVDFEPWHVDQDAQGRLWERFDVRIVAAADADDAAHIRAGAPGA